jgi:acyl dehydratase
MDTTEVDRWVGVPLGGGQFREPIALNDVRRWAQGMQNANPLYYDADYAAESVFGQIVAPQSFTVNCTVGHGAIPAVQGYIEGTHMLFGGDEWWFFDPKLRILPGDRFHSDRMLFDYVVKETKFAGPTMFSRGDTTYINQRGEVVARQRSTSIRYYADEAVRRADYTQTQHDPEWTDAQLADLEKQKLEYIRAIRDLGHEKRLFVKPGEKLLRRPIGPHTIMTFTTEWRAYTFTVWGATCDDRTSTSDRVGWIPEMDRDLEGGELDPSALDGIYKGPSRGHAQPRYARLIGMPRGYGYGATMGAWVLDYLNNWAGEHGFVLHTDVKYRGPALTGDVTFLDGEVTAVGNDDPRGPIASVEVVMSNQKGEIMARGPAEVLLPRM